MCREDGRREAVSLRSKTFLRVGVDAHKRLHFQMTMPQKRVQRVLTGKILEGDLSRDQEPNVGLSYMKKTCTPTYS